MESPDYCSALGLLLGGYFRLLIKLRLLSRGKSGSRRQELVSVVSEWNVREIFKPPPRRAPPPESALC